GRALEHRAHEAIREAATRSRRGLEHDQQADAHRPVVGLQQEKGLVNRGKSSHATILPRRPRAAISQIASCAAAITQAMDLRTLNSFSSFCSTSLPANDATMLPSRGMPQVTSKFHSTEQPPFSGCSDFVPTIFTGTPLISVTMSAL